MEQMTDISRSAIQGFCLAILKRLALGQANETF